MDGCRADVEREGGGKGEEASVREEERKGWGDGQKRERKRFALDTTPWVVCHQGNPFFGHLGKKGQSTNHTHEVLDNREGEGERREEDRGFSPAPHKLQLSSATLRGFC